MKRLFNIILAVALISIALVSCTERIFLEFDQPSCYCEASSEGVTLHTNMPIEFLGVCTDNGANYLDCSYRGNSLECNGGWFTASCSKNGNEVLVTLNDNSSKSEREIKIQVISKGMAATCTLVQSGR